MKSRIQITLESETQRRARRRASNLGISLTEYVRRLLERDLGGAGIQTDPALVFDLGRSSGCDIAKQKNPILAEAMESRLTRRRRR